MLIKENKFEKKIKNHLVINKFKKYRSSLKFDFSIIIKHVGIQTAYYRPIAVFIPILVYLDDFYLAYTL